MAAMTKGAGLLYQGFFGAVVPTPVGGRGGGDVSFIGAPQVGQNRVVSSTECPKGQIFPLAGAALETGEIGDPAMVEGANGSAGLTSEIPHLSQKAAPARTSCPLGQMRPGPEPSVVSSLIERPKEPNYRFASHRQMTPSCLQTTKSRGSNPSSRGR